MTSPKLANRRNAFKNQTKILCIKLKELSPIRAYEEDANGNSSEVSLG